MIGWRWPPLNTYMNNKVEDGPPIDTYMNDRVEDAAPKTPNNDIYRAGVDMIEVPPSLAIHTSTTS
jgi:hypothetical protein